MGMKVLSIILVFTSVHIGAQEHHEHLKNKIGSELCEKIKNKWGNYEKQWIVTLLSLEKWPAHRKGAPVYLAQNKEVFKDRVEFEMDGKKTTVLMDDFKILAGLHYVNMFEDYGKEVLRFDNLRNFFANEDEVWEHLNS